MIDYLSAPGSLASIGRGLGIEWYNEQKSEFFIYMFGGVNYNGSFSFVGMRPVLNATSTILQRSMSDWSQSNAYGMEEPLPYLAEIIEKHQLEGPALSGNPDTSGHEAADFKEPVIDHPAIWGHTVSLRDCSYVSNLGFSELVEGLWDFGMLALADKVNLPIEKPAASWDFIGLRLWLDAIERIRGSDLWDDGIERFSLAIRRLWDENTQFIRVTADKALESFMKSPVINGIPVPRIELLLLENDCQNHFVSLLFRRQSDGMISVIFSNSDPILDRKYLGSRTLVSYLYKDISVAGVKSFLESSIGRDIRWRETIKSESAENIFNTMEFYFGRPQPLEEAWELQQVQWDNSCLPKSISILLRHEYIHSEEEANSIKGLYKYKIMKGAISRVFVDLLQEIFELTSENLIPAGREVLKTLHKQANHRQRYQVLRDAVRALKLNGDHQALIVSHVARVVKALESQSRSYVPFKGSKSSLNRFLTMQCQQTQSSLQVLWKIMESLQKTANLDQAETVAMAILHWGDRLIRPIDDGKAGVLADIPQEQRGCLDLRLRICHTAKRTLKYASFDNQALRRFFKEVKNVAYAKVEPRSPTASPIRAIESGVFELGGSSSTCT